MWAAAAGALLSYVGNKKAKKEDQQYGTMTNEKEAMYQRQLSEFNVEQEDYYNQLNKARKMRGLDEFRKFSSVQSYMPGYHDDNPGPILPDKPEFNQGKYTPAPDPKREKFSWTKKLTQPFYRIGEFE